MTETILTIGHSTHPVEKFLELLGKNGVTALCDVRSAPYSRMNPQFNRETLRDILQKAGVAYFFLGKELGARSDNPACYKNHQVQYELLEKTAPFQKGVDKVCELAKKYCVALMCAEKDPLACHRTILVSRALAGKGLNIEHILADGAIEAHDQAIARLLKQLHLPEADMFRAKDEIIDEAYRKQGQAIAYEEKADVSAYGYS